MIQFIHFTLIRFFFILGFAISTTVLDLVNSKIKNREFNFDYIIVSLFSMVVFALLVP